MKYITFTVPCYNSQDYMRKCIESLLIGGEDVEIIIINDGSKDATFSIAQEYAEQYTDIVRVVDKENGGHGSGVNEGLRLATGLYFKVVDSDDWVDREALKKLLSTIKVHHGETCLPDMYVVNYVYEHVADKTQHVSRYNKKFRSDVFCGWNKVKTFHFSHMLLMHALVYRTDVLRKSGLVLPEHTFYVDDIVSYNPLPYTKTLYYLNIDFYRYFIGRTDQSVNLPNMVERYEQMVRVMLAMADCWSYYDIRGQPKGLRHYMCHALANYMMTTELFICAEDSTARRKVYCDMWLHIKTRDKKLYRKLRYRTYVVTTIFLPWKLRSFLHLKFYKFLCKRIKLG